jgi:hypothetical protein
VKFFEAPVYIGRGRRKGFHSFLPSLHTHIHTHINIYTHTYVKSRPIFGKDSLEVDFFVEEGFGFAGAEPGAFHGVGVLGGDGIAEEGEGFVAWFLDVCVSLMGIMEGQMA